MPIWAGINNDGGDAFAVPRVMGGKKLMIAFGLDEDGKGLQSCLRFTETYREVEVMSALVLKANMRS